MKSLLLAAFTSKIMKIRKTAINRLVDDEVSGSSII